MNFEEVIQRFIANNELPGLERKDINDFVDDNDEFKFYIEKRDKAVYFNYLLKKYTVEEAKNQILKVWQMLLIMTKLPGFTGTKNALNIDEDDEIYIDLEDNETGEEYKWNDDACEFVLEGTYEVGGGDDDLDTGMENDEGCDDECEDEGLERDEDCEEVAENEGVDVKYAMIKSTINDDAWKFEYTISNDADPEETANDIIFKWTQKLNEHPVDKKIEVIINVDDSSFTFVWDEDEKSFIEYVDGFPMTAEVEIDPEDMDMDDTYEGDDCGDEDDNTTGTPGDGGCEYDNNDEVPCGYACPYHSSAEAMLKCLQDDNFYKNIFDRIMAMDLTNYIVKIDKSMNGDILSFTVRLDLNKSEYYYLNHKMDLFKGHIIEKYGYTNVTYTYDFERSVDERKVLNITFFF